MVGKVMKIPAWIRLIKFWAVFLVEKIFAKAKGTQPTKEELRIMNATDIAKVINPKLASKIKWSFLLFLSFL